MTRSSGWRESCEEKRRMGEGRLGGGEQCRLSVLDMSLDGESGRQTAKASFSQ